MIPHAHGVRGAGVQGAGSCGEDGVVGDWWLSRLLLLLDGHAFARACSPLSCEPGADLYCFLRRVAVDGDKWLGLQSGRRICGREAPRDRLGYRPL
jgi:hypothetical protein